MIDIYTAKVPITYTELIEDDGVTVQNTTIIGYLTTSNLLASMQYHKNVVDDLLRR